MSEIDHRGLDGCRLGLSTGQPLRLNVGIVDILPKLVVGRLLQPALALPEPVRMV